MKLRLRNYLFIACSIFLLASCSNNNTDADQTTENEKENGVTPSGETFTIGTLPAEAALPIILAEENGYFEEIGVDVSIKTFTSPNDRNVALQANELDAAIGDVMTTAAFVDRGINLKITSDINEDFKILSSPGSNITNIQGLDDKDVSLVPNFILEYIMDEMAIANDFNYNIVEIPSFSGRSEALLSNQIDGVVFTEPQAGMLVQQGAHLLASSNEAGIKGGTIFFTEEMIQNYPEDIKAFYTAYNQAIDYMNETNANDYADILSNYQFPAAMSDYINNKDVPYTHAASIDQDQFDRIIKWTKEKEQIEQTYSYDDLTDFSFIK
ncbi:Putative aliphatic sulfonates-binding protein precursor [Paraliobacillus sp. PM-2]|uniref:ABC transporter substrate-binding protein n=1 Tax=Paraliobacillus sp. PM-2 TaxID=1462524 RepID=UPI00061BCEC1|nr:ABC transporter substrate-binding protein [Paraliobacillus sp. PM-2]CQR45966.1 Putative aliphatic sulfonates-binding protein precursor [Paraliobacillus sp. PM-2]